MIQPASLAPWGDQPQQHGGSRLGHPAFLARYEGFASNYIAELFAQLAYVADYVDVTAIELPCGNRRLGARLWFTAPRHAVPGRPSPFIR